jgi:hypothetical protein
VNGISAETYVRRCAEDELRAVHDEEGEPRGFRERIRALVFVGLLDIEVASGIVSGYGRARAVRGLGGYPGDEPSPGAQAAGPTRVARCSGEIDVSDATIVPRLVTLGPHRTRLAVTIRAASGAGTRRGRRHRPMIFDVDEITLRDDKGRSVTAHLSGGGSSEWSGWYEAEPGLSPDTAWVDVEGTRLPLDDTRAGATVTVETWADAELSTEQRATRYLDHCARSFADQESSALATIAETLVTCGALAPDSPSVTSLVAADEDGAPHPTAYPGPGWAFHLHSQARRGRQPATATVIIGVTTPPIDGVSVAVTDLESTPDGFQIEIDGVGPVEFSRGYASSIDTPRLATRATDDRGNDYRGSLAEFEGGSEGFSGTVRFTPALDPGASIVNLEFSTERARAIVHVPLQWGDRS